MREVTVERLGLAGEGLGAGVRIPFSLPGERARGPVAAGVLAPVEILAASPHRATPPCRHFGLCGGCALQHASDAFVADWKRDVLVRALAARGLHAEIAPTRTSPAHTRRRATFTARRTRKTVVLGFHLRRSEALFDLLECHVLRPELVAARPALVAATAIAGSRNRPLRLAVTLSDAGLDLDIAQGESPGPEQRRRLAALAEDFDLARLSCAGEPIALRRQPCQTFGRARVVPPPRAFLQATAEGEAALVAFVREGLAGAGRVADLFAGCGTFALPLAEAAEVHAVEGDAAMLASLDAGWRAAAGLRRVTTEARDLFRRPLLRAELDRYAGVVIDPPRAGAEAQMHALAASAVPRVVAVSCNPVSFARDAAILTRGGYRLESVQAVDQFRWSGHVELAARFRR